MKHVEKDTLDPILYASAFFPHPDGHEFPVLGWQAVFANLFVGYFGGPLDISEALYR